MKKVSKLYVVLLSSLTLSERRERSIISLQERKDLENNLFLFIVVVVHRWAVLENIYKQKGKSRGEVKVKNESMNDLLHVRRN